MDPSGFVPTPRLALLGRKEALVYTETDGGVLFYLVETLFAQGPNSLAGDFPSLMALLVLHSLPLSPMFRVSLAEP